MRKRYTLPAVIGDSRLDTILALLSSVRDELDIEVSFARLSDILPAGHAILACIVDACCEKNCNVQICDISRLLVNKMPVVKLLSGVSASSALLPPSNFLLDWPNYSLRCFTGLPTSQWIINYFDRCKTKVSEDKPCANEF